MSIRLTRREWTAGLAAALPLAAQKPEAPQDPPAGTPADGDLLAAAREGNRRNSELLAKFELPLATEPSFTFRP